MSDAPQSEHKQFTLEGRATTRVHSIHNTTVVSRMPLSCKCGNEWTAKETDGPNYWEAGLSAIFITCPACKANDQLLIPLARDYRP